MANKTIQAMSVAAAALLLATSAHAQGKGPGDHKGKGHDRDARNEQSAVVRRSDNAAARDADRRRDEADRRRNEADRRRNDAQYRDSYGNVGRVPPGLAKKPGQMPPGQYKKRYDTNQGADVLGGIFREHGYTVDRISANGDSRYVYYRTRDGGERRAIVSQGTDRLRFSNVPSSLLQEVLSRLY